ncbi:MAG: HAD family hydrolase [Burkholderiales bacterium]|nr:HAD family hydrolase [Burkholderiales bacterium]
MQEPPIRIAMWSGPRNISTAMMRSFGARADTAVTDEPFYAAYLVQTGLVHPMRQEVIASQPNDWRDVVAGLLGPVPGDRPVWYQKHMTHHMIPAVGREWLGQVRNAFLIRDPAAVLASYVAKRGEVTLADIGIVQQRELFEQESDRLGRAPPVVEGADILAEPGRVLAKLCAALGIAYDAAMLHWPPGRRDSDGVWAPAWYDAVERSTGFERPAARERVALGIELQRIADAARPHYEALVEHKLR